jgi:HEAT repeat protein
VDVRVAAAKTLQALGDPRAVEPLIQAMGSEYRLVRAAAARALYEVGDGRAVDPMIAALKDGFDPVRVAAAGTLGRLGDRSAVEPLVAASGDWYNGVRAAAMRSLGYFGGPRVAEPLITGLRDPHANVRVEAASALGRLRDPRASGPLIVALVDQDPSVRKAATLALDAMGEPVGRLLIEALAGIPEARRELVKRKDPRVVNPLIHELRNPDAKVRRNAARILGDLGDPRAIDGLVGMAGGWNPADRSVATFALSQLDYDGTGLHNAALRVAFAPATIALGLGFCAAGILLLYRKRLLPKAFRRKTSHRRPPRYDWPGWR